MDDSPLSRLDTHYPLVDNLIHIFIWRFMSKSHHVLCSLHLASVSYMQLTTKIIESLTWSIGMDDIVWPISLRTQPMWLFGKAQCPQILHFTCFMWEEGHCLYKSSSKHGIGFLWSVHGDEQVSLYKYSRMPVIKPLW